MEHSLMFIVSAIAQLGVFLDILSQLGAAQLDKTSFDNRQLHTFLMRNSFVRNLHWDSEIAKKLSDLKPQRLRHL